MKGPRSVVGTGHAVFVGPPAQLGQGPGVVVEVAEALGPLPEPARSRNERNGTSLLCEIQTHKRLTRMLI